MALVICWLLAEGFGKTNGVSGKHLTGQPPHMRAGAKNLMLNGLKKRGTRMTLSMRHVLQALVAPTVWHVDGGNGGYVACPLLKGRETKHQIVGS